MTSVHVMDGQDVRSSLRVEVVTELPALEDLRTQWLDLLSRTPMAIAFSTPAAVQAWFRHVERYAGIYVVTVWRGERLVGLSPFSVVRLGPFRVFASAGAGYGFFGGPLLGPEPDPVAHALHDHLATLLRGGRAALYVRRMPTEHPLLGVLYDSPSVVCSAMGSDETNSIVDFDLMSDPEKYFAQVSRKHAVPRRTRRLTEQVQSLDVLPRDPDPDDALDAMRDMIVRRFGEDLRMFRGPHNRRFTRELVHGLIADDHAQIASIKADGRRIAVTVDLHVGTRTFWYAVAYEPDFYDFSIGHIELYSFLRRAHTAGVTAVDLGSSGFNYKRRWANSEVRFRTLAVTTAGRPAPIANLLRRVCITAHRRFVRFRDAGLPIV